MEKKRINWWRISLCVILTLLCVGMIAWIFSNSLQTAEESTEQSAGFMEKLQALFTRIAPDSFIATATGESYNALHKWIRIGAHFCEFALLGALLVWCLRSYTGRRIFLLIPLLLIIVVPVIDETLQSFTGGRAMELTDVLVDVAGGICGGAFALFTLWIGNKIVVKKRKKVDKNGEGQLTGSVNQVQQEDVV